VSRDEFGIHAQYFLSGTTPCSPRLEIDLDPLLDRRQYRTHRTPQTVAKEGQPVNVEIVARFEVVDRP